MKIQLTDIGVKRCESECLLVSGLKTYPTGGKVLGVYRSFLQLLRTTIFKGGCIVRG